MFIVLGDDGGERGVGGRTGFDGDGPASHAARVGRQQHVRGGKQHEQHHKRYGLLDVVVTVRRGGMRRGGGGRGGRGGRGGLAVLRARTWLPSVPPFCWQQLLLAPAPGVLTPDDCLRQRKLNKRLEREGFLVASLLCLFSSVARSVHCRLA
ncbi:hypothetical protein [Cynomolgus macaque cytomegalovirus strain Mauritius]|uniref:Uncharacterized protein n=1 Tax=Cynomolgus macaque cytomegalovirus strain Mauritius TaxID=1690255 RepID=A0A0K1H009_9BETA|nr:hypothetical protein [Cynomolgus macaque cytomegalovirus strain Mauritius]AXG21904.1 hypothetical protein [synthetic construct]AXG22173.1 hypothetical protein [synthetic construct]